MTVQEFTQDLKKRYGRKALKNLELTFVAEDFTFEPVASYKGQDEADGALVVLLEQVHYARKA